MPQAAGFVVGALGLGGAVTGASAFAVGVGLGASAGFVTTLAIRLAASVALSALATALSPKPKVTLPGLRTDATLTGGINPEGFILGRFASAGVALAPQMSHTGTDGPPNGYLNYVVEYQGIPGAQPVSVLINGIPCEISDDSPHPDYGQRLIDADNRYTGNAWFRWHDGTQTDADAMLMAKYPVPHVRPWTSAMIGHGLCYGVATFRYEREVYQQFPNFKLVLDGLSLYDPRKDSTAGGSGAQRWNNPATWEFTRNPLVMVYNIMRGITLPNGDVWGGGFTASDLPYVPWVAAMDACDAPVSDGNGGTEPACHAGMEVFVDDEPLGVIEELLKSANAKLAEDGGVWTPRVGGPTLPVLTITDGDLLSDASDDLTPFPRLSEVFNAISATFTDPASAWQAREVDPVYNATWEAEDDGRRLVTSLSLPAVTRDTQAQRLIRDVIADHRRMRVHTVVTSFIAGALTALDSLAWTSAANGYTAKTFEASAVTRSAQTGRVSLIMREMDPGDWGHVAVTPVAVPDLRPVVPAPQGVPGWDADPWTVKDTDSASRRPAIKCQWSTGYAPDARALRIQWRLTGDAASMREVLAAYPDAGEYVIEDVLPDTAYQVRARYAVDRQTVWSDWKQARTGDVRLGLDDFTVPVAENLDRLHDWIDWMDGDLTIPGLPPIPSIPDVPGVPIIPDLPYFIAQGLVEIPKIATAAQTLETAWLGVLENRLDGDFLAKRGIDAGILTDPATGQVRIAGVANLEDRQSAAEIRVDGLASQISLRATYTDVARMVSDAVLVPSQIPIITDLEQRVVDVEITLDGQAGTIASKADALVVNGLDLRVGTAESDIDVLQGQMTQRVTTATFDALGDRVGAAELQLESMDAPQIALTVQDTRRLTADIDADAIQTLDDMLSSYADRAVIREANAAAQMQLRAVVDDGLTAEAQARTALATDLDNVRATLLVDYYTRSEADSAQASALTQLQTTMESPGGSVALAQAAAQSAFDLAGEKGVVLTQNAAPAAKYREPQNLWIDTTNSANTPKRWNGSEWVAVTDKVATDAAAAAQSALNALPSKLDASVIQSYYTKVQADSAVAQAVNQLQSTMETPGGSVYAAQQAAQAASDLAGTKGRVFVQTSAPTGSDRDAKNLWIDTTNSANTPKRWNGSEWAAVTDKVATDAAAAAQSALNALPSKLDASVITNYYTKTETNNALAQTETLVSANAQSVGRLQRDTDADALQTLDDMLSSEADRQAIRNLSADAALQMRAVVDDGLAAEAQARIALTATVDDVRALLSTDYYVKSDADQATAQMLQQLRSTLEGPGGSIAAAQADATAALNALPSKADASALSNIYVKSEVDNAVAQAVNQLQSTMETPGGSVYAAQQAAQAASDLAGTKGRVFVQTSAPTGSDRDAKNLWIDTTNSANTPKRWNGSKWVAVTDKVATDAAAAAQSALNALPSKLDASVIQSYYTKVQADSAVAQAVNQLQSTMETPGGSVYAAQQAAQAASDLAGTKGRVFVQTSAPTGSDRDAKNLWIDTTGGANTPKRWNGSKWVAVTDKVATDAAAAAQSALNALPSKLDASVIQSYYTKVQADEKDQALADALTALSASSAAGDVSQANFRMTTLSGPAGYARIGAQTRVGGTGNWRGAAWYLDTPNVSGPTRFVVEADRFVVTKDGGGERLVWQDGALRIFNDDDVEILTLGVL